MTANQSELSGIGQPVALDVAEERAEALDRAEDDVADDGGDEGGEQRLDLEVVAVHDLGREHRAAERSAEDRADARADPARDGDAGVRRAQVEEPGEERSEARTDLARRAFSTARAARADGERRGDDLDGDGAQPDAAGVVVDGSRWRRRCRAPRRRARCRRRGSPRARAPTQATSGIAQGRAKCAEAARASLADWRRNRVPGDHPEEQVGRRTQCLVEDDRAEAGDDADEGAEHEPLANVGGRGEPTRRREPAAIAAALATARKVTTIPLHLEVPARRPVLFRHLAASRSQPTERLHEDDLLVHRYLATMRSISRRRRAVTASTRAAPLGRQRDPELAPVVSLGPTADQVLAHEPVAHPRRRGRSDPDGIGETGKALRPPRREHDERAVLGERDLLGDVRERAGGNRHEDPARR